MRSAPWILLTAALMGVACTDDRPAVVDRDRDGVAAGIDCDDSDPAVHATVVAYLDADGDGIGAGTASSLCTAGAPPPGYALAGSDCAPADPAAWREASLVDRDGDGYTVAAAEPLCAGATLPEPYREAASGNDCDDRDATRFRWIVVYRDQDGDGVGARPRSIPCVGTSAPAGFVPRGYDEDDLDAGVVSDPAQDALGLILE